MMRPLVLRLVFQSWHGVASLSEATSRPGVGSWVDLFHRSCAVVAAGRTSGRSARPGSCTAVAARVVATQGLAIAAFWRAGDLGSLWSNGCTLVIGAFLADDECKALADTMRQALDELKAGPGLTGLERKQ